MHLLFYEKYSWWERESEGGCSHKHSALIITRRIVISLVEQN